MDLFSKKKNLSKQSNASTDSPYITDLDNTKKEIDTLLYHLDYQTDPDLIDSYSYQLKGAYLRYKFYLRQIRELTNS